MISSGTLATIAAPGDRYGNRVRRQQTVPDEPGSEPAPRLSFAGLQVAVLLLASGAGVGGRLPAMRGKTVQGPARSAWQDRHVLPHTSRGRYAHLHR